MARPPVTHGPAMMTMTLRSTVRATLRGGAAFVPLLGIPAAALSIPAAAADATAKVTFVDHALPVLRQRCGSCHNADKKTAGLDVTTYSGIMAGGGSGEVITPGDASQSYLYRVVTHEDEPTMPPDGPPIPEAERKVLQAWIDGGVLENSGSRPVIVKKVDVAMAAPTGERPQVVPMPAHLPLEPVVRTPAVDACASLATSPWAPLAAVCGQKQVLLYRTDSMELAGVLPFPEGRPHVVNFSRGGGLVLAGGGVGAASGRVAIWDLRSGRRLRTLGDELDAVLAADISPDQRLVVLGGPPRVPRIYSIETGEKLHDLGKHTDWILAASFSPDGALLATADRAGGVFVWEAATGRDYLTIPAHPAAVTSLAWRADSNMLATGCDDGQIRLFEPENGTQVKAWAAHGGGVAALEFTRDGRLASIGRDKTPKLWKPDGSQERAFEACADVGLAASYCDETNRLLVGDWTGEIRVWSAADGGRAGQIDPNPPRINERAEAAEKLFGERRTQLATTEQAVAAGAAALAKLPQDRAAAVAAQQAATQALPVAEKSVADTAAAATAAKTAHEAAVAALPPLEQALAAAMGEAKQATDALAAAGDDAAKKDAAMKALAAAQAKAAEAQGRRDAHRTEIDKQAAAAAEAAKQAAAAVAARDQAKAAVAAAGQKITEIDAALAAVQAEQPKRVASLVEIKAQVASAAEAQARWLREAAFQAAFVDVSTTLGRREESLGRAESDAVAAEEKRQADEQARAAAVAERDSMNKRLEALAAAVATGEGKVKELSAQVEKRGGELAATQTAIEQTLQGIAVLEEAGKSLQKGLGVAADDADLKQSLAAVTAARDAKQARLKQQQDTLATMMTEKGQWEQAIVAERAQIEKHRQEHAAVTESLKAVTAKIDAATAVVAAATKVVEEKRAAVAARQSELDATVKQLDALQGIGS
jgi:hypothetical protein